MSSPESILHIGKFYVPHPGGIETHLRDLVRIQSREAHVEVLVAGSRKSTSREHVDGATVTRVATYGTVASQPVVPALPFYLRGHREDIVHLHTPNPGGAFALWTARHPGKLIVTHHGDTSGRPVLRRLSDPFVRATMRRAAAILVSSQRYLDSSDELHEFRDRCRLVPLGIDLNSQVTPQVAEIAAVRNQFAGTIVLAAGRLVPYKGFACLLSAMRRVDANLLLAGTGPQRAELESMSRDYGMSDRVHFLGFVPDLGPYFHAADLFVMPSISRAESFGLVQLEAMAAGLPVINTWLDSAVPEVSLDGETGITVPPGDSDALATAIGVLVADADLRARYGRAARLRAAGFTAERNAAMVMEIYRQVL